MKIYNFQSFLLWQINNFYLDLLSEVSYLWQSFVVALLAMVIATFSTGIDSKCFQVCPAIHMLFESFIIKISKNMSDNNCSSGRTSHRPKMMFPMVMVSFILFLPLEPCTLQCCWLGGILITPLKSTSFNNPKRIILYFNLIEFKLIFHIISNASCFPAWVYD